MREILNDNNYYYFQIFFVLRKKNNQLTFLHICHHWGMYMTLWTATKYFAGGAGTWLLTINSTVHVFMYSYYTLTALKVPWAAHIAVKRFITQIQLVRIDW